MLDLNTVTQDILSWCENFVEVPHPALGGWPPCPYARQARLTGDFDVRIGTDPLTDLKEISWRGLGGKSVVAIAYDPVAWPHDQFAAALEKANVDFLLNRS